jgi:DNA-binding LacI/PurR family transcriptional regulator
MKMPIGYDKRKLPRLSRDKRNREFLYRQLSGILEKEIGAGKYKPGERLPSMDDLAALYAVNKVTVRRALSDLNAAGIIYSVPAQGTYVADQPRPARYNGQRSQTLTVGLVSFLMVPGNTGLYHMEIIQGIREELSKLQANFLILPVRNVEPQYKILDQMAQANVDAAIYLGMFDQSSLRRMFENGPTPVLVDFAVRGLQVDTIVLDNKGGAYQAMEYLLSLGHKKLSIILGQPNQVATKDRLDGAYEALDNAGIARDSVRIFQGDFQREGGYAAMAEILKGGDLPTAIFCFNDEMAAGAMQALHALSSLKVPQDMSIMGFDDTAWATATQPPLSTIQVPKSMMGRLAVQRIIARRKAHEQPTTTVLSTQLMIRGSTAPVVAVPAQP